MKKNPPFSFFHPNKSKKTDSLGFIEITVSGFASKYFNQILKSERLVFILKQDEQRKQNFTMKIYFLDENEQLRFAQHRIPWIISG
jgi:hypothetical protein